MRRKEICWKWCKSGFRHVSVIEISYLYTYILVFCLFVFPTAYYRFVVLFFNCLLTFGSYFCFDIPSVLQDQFQGVSHRKGELTDSLLIDSLSVIIVNTTKAVHRFADWLPSIQQNLTCPNATVINGTTDCVLGLGMSPQQYNLLYAIYAWT